MRIVVHKNSIKEEFMKDASQVEGIKKLLNKFFPLKYNYYFVIKQLMN